jgi:hypothetical protein
MFGRGLLSVLGLLSLVQYPIRNFFRQTIEMFGELKSGRSAIEHGKVLGVIVLSAFRNALPELCLA